MKWALLFSILLGLSTAVKREDFRTCEQSAFCKAHRAISELTGYFIVPGSVSVSGSLFTANLKNDDNTLVLRVFGLEDSVVRIQIDETEAAIRKRFVPEFALNGKPVEAAFSNTKLEGASTTVVSADGNTRVVISHSPFIVSIFNSKDELVAVVNREGKLKVEEFRTKEEGKEYPPGFWEESFKSFHDSKPFGSSSVGVDISFVGFKSAFGLPEHAEGFALKTTSGSTDPYRLYNLDVFEYELNNPMALYVAVPYIVAHKKSATVGALWLNAAETWIDTKSTSSEKGVFRSMIDKVLPGEAQIPHFDAHFMSETGLVDIFFFTGPTPQAVQRQYSGITGKTPLPPLFSIAYHQCRWNYNDEQDVAQVHAKFDEYDIPVDVMWLDIEHTDGKKYFTWDQHKFPNPKQMIEGLSSKGRKMVTIIDPHIKKDNSYYVYKDAKDLSLFVKKSDGETDFEGHCWPGASEYLDFLHPKTREYWVNQFKFDRYIGSTPDLHTWNDMNEPSVFSGPEVTMDKNALHYGGIEHREVHNMYGLYYHSATFEGLLQRTEGQDRPFLLTRSGFVGTQRSAAIWTGDNTADWGHLAVSGPMLLSLGIAGNPFVGADVGGFFGNPDAQLLTRWYQAAAFQPFMRAHAHIDTRRREPWEFGEETREHIRSAIRRRYELLPLWYTLFRVHSLNGSLPMRPVWHTFPEEERLFNTDDEWMVGDSLLVRPVVEKDAVSAKVDLPSESDERTRWYEWEGGQEVAAGIHHVDAPIDHIPVYQRGGSIVPTWQRIRRAAPLMIDDPYTLIIGLDPKGNAKGIVYTDDGKTHDYKNNKFAFSTFEFKSVSKSKAVITGDPDPDGIFDAKNWIEKIEVRGLKSEPSEVTIVRSSDPVAKLQYTYDRDLHLLTIRKPAAPITQTFKITIKFGS